MCFLRCEWEEGGDIRCYLPFLSGSSCCALPGLWGVSRLEDCIVRGLGLTCSWMKGAHKVRQKVFRRYKSIRQACCGVGRFAL